MCSIEGWEWGPFPAFPAGARCLISSDWNVNCLLISRANSRDVKLLGKIFPGASPLGNCIDGPNGWTRPNRRVNVTTMTLTAQTVFLENESWLRTVVRSRVQETDAVEDIMQNIALALVRQRDTLREIGQLGGWLYQVAVKQVLMYRRTKGRRRNFHNRLVTQTSPESLTSNVDPAAGVLAAEERSAVREAMQELDELDRQVMMLKYVEGWTYRQLADNLGVSENTIEYRLLKARRRLKSMLADRMETAYVR